MSWELPEEQQLETQSFLPLGTPVDWAMFLSPSNLGVGRVTRQRVTVPWNCSAAVSQLHVQSPLKEPLLVTCHQQQLLTGLQ